MDTLTRTKATVQTRTAALAMPPGALRDATLAALGELNSTVAYDHEDACDWSGLPAALSEAAIEVLLFDVESVTEAELTRSLAGIKERLPLLRSIAIHPYDDPARILMAMRAGANEFIYSPIGPALEAAFARIPAPRSTQPERDRQEKVIGFVSAKGGCGATTAACHIAADLKLRTGKEVLLAELDVAPGPLAFLMKTHGQYTLNDALDNISRLDGNFWSALLAPSRTGVNVLQAPTRFMPGDGEPERIQRLIRFMRSHHDWSILDFGRGINPLLAAAAEGLDELFVITTVDLPSLHMAKSMLRSLPGAFERIPVRLLLNRTQKAVDVSVDEIQKIFGRPVHATLPDDFEALYAAYSSGGLLRPDTALGAAFSRIAMTLAGEAPKVKAKRFLLW